MPFLCHFSQVFQDCPNWFPNHLCDATHRDPPSEMQIWLWFCLVICWFLQQKTKQNPCGSQDRPSFWWTQSCSIWHLSIFPVSFLSLLHRQLLHFKGLSPRKPSHNDYTMMSHTLPLLGVQMSVTWMPLSHLSMSFKTFYSFLSPPRKSWSHVVCTFKSDN